VSSDESHLEWGQALRAWWRGIRVRISNWRVRAKAASEDAVDAGSDVIRGQRIGRTARIALAVAIILIVIYPVSAWLYSTIDDNPQFGPTNDDGNAKESQTVAGIAALLNREINTHGWAASAPFFEPPALLEDMPKYQEGIVKAIANVTIGLHDRDNASDTDLASATELLQYPPDVWYWNPRQSLWPKEPSDDEYQRAMADLMLYNESLGDGSRQLDRSSDTLTTVLQRITQDLGTSSAMIEYHVDRGTRPRVQERTDDIFYGTNGRLYGYYIALKGMEIDFRGVIASRHLTATWASMMSTLRGAIGMRPSIVLDGSPDSDFVPCTLCGEGFYVLRLQDELEDITRALNQG
jgi:hypothetical protein